jgi:acetolactate synthase I/II/III large subunit
MPGTRRVVDYLVESLAAIGVDHIFGVDGGHCSGRMGVIAGDGAFLVHGGEAHTALPASGGDRVVQQQRAKRVREPELRFSDDRCSYHRFRSSPPGADPAVARAVRTALDVDAPAVVSIECAADDSENFC